MLNVPSIYPQCKQISLDKNFRCGKLIADHSQKLIQHNQTRFSKEISPFRKEIGSIWVKDFETFQTESAFLVHSIKEGLSKGLSFQDMAVLFRIHSSTKNLIFALYRANIPFLLKDRIPSIFDHWICQDLFCFLRLAHRQGTREDLIHILDRPFRGIYRSDLGLQWNPVNLKENFQIPEIRKRTVFQEFFQKIEFLSTLTPVLSLSFILHALGYESFLRQHAFKHGIPMEDLLGIIHEIQELAKETTTFPEFQQMVQEQHEIFHSDPPKDYDGISLMSFHSSKGLEFKRVYLIDCNQDITPYKKALTLAEIEEERRMFYVAVTRAKDELFLCYLDRLYNKKLTPSRFLSEFLGNDPIN